LTAKSIALLPFQLSHLPTEEDGVTSTRSQSHSAKSVCSCDDSRSRSFNIQPPHFYIRNDPYSIPNMADDRSRSRSRSRSPDNRNGDSGGGGNNDNMPPQSSGHDDHNNNNGDDNNGHHGGGGGGEDSGNPNEVKLYIGNLDYGTCQYIIINSLLLESLHCVFYYMLIPCSHTPPVSQYLLKKLNYKQPRMNHDYARHSVPTVR
jgi:hypothetical protein